VPGRDGPDLDALLAGYAAAVRDGLMTCAVADGLHRLRQATAGARWLIVSGGDQAELREVFAARGLDGLFDGGIFGSPDTKDAILARQLDAGTIGRPALFLGDSRLDLQAAGRAGLDFVFVHGWTEVPDWPALVAQAGVRSIRQVADLLNPEVTAC
jgi:phosphoglycolate phosphatase-like HAD superfamily hydrolase